MQQAHGDVQPDRLDGRGERNALHYQHNEQAVTHQPGHRAGGVVGQQPDRPGLRDFLAVLGGDGGGIAAVITAHPWIARGAGGLVKEVPVPVVSGIEDQ